MKTTSQNTQIKTIHCIENEGKNIKQQNNNPVQ